jgi:hypothetical protein
VKRYVLHEREHKYNEIIEDAIRCFMNCRLIVLEENVQMKKTTLIYDDFEDEDIKDDKKEFKEKKQRVFNLP